MIDSNRNERIPKILVVDDDPISRRMFQTMLSKEGFDVITSLNGREGRMAAEHDQPDLIIMDIMMPEEDGLTACVGLKSTPHTANIPVVFISSVEDVSSKINGFNAGGVDYITKPYQISEVLARVRLQIRLYHTYHTMMAAHLEQLKNLTESQKNFFVNPDEFPEANFGVFYVKEIPVARGDRIFLFSDGLIEQDQNGLLQRRTGLTNLVGLIKEKPTAQSSPEPYLKTGVKVELLPPAPPGIAKKDPIWSSSGSLLATRTHWRRSFLRCRPIWACLSSSFSICRQCSRALWRKVWINRAL